MSYEIEFQDQGQDLIRLTVDQDTGEITDAGRLSWLYADGSNFVIVGDLTIDRTLRYRTDGDDEIKSFKYLMTKVSLNGELLTEAA